MGLSRAECKEFYQSQKWRRLRKQILERDHYECLWCKAEGKLTTSADTILEVDHIKELEHYPEYALDEDNLRTLCKQCHNKRHERFDFRQTSKKKTQLFREDEWWGHPPVK